MELRSRKLPSPFEPRREDREDQERITLTRSFSPDVHHRQPDPDEFGLDAAIGGVSQPTPYQPDFDPEDCYIPPSGTPAKGHDNYAARCQPDPDFEELYFSPSGTLTGGDETNQHQPDPDDLSFRPYDMPVIGGANDPSQFGPDHRPTGSTPAASTANLSYGRPSTQIPMHRSRDMSYVPEEPVNPDPNHTIRPIHRPRAVHHNTAVSYQSFQPTRHDLHAPPMPRHSQNIQTELKPNIWRFPRSHRVEPNYIDPARSWRADVNQLYPRRPASPVWRDPNIHCPWRSSSEETYTRDQERDLARNRFSNQRFSRQEQFEVHRHQNLHPTSEPTSNRYYDRYSRNSPRHSDEPRPSFPTFNGKMGDWDAFWLKFQLLSDRYGWTGQKLVDQLLLSLKDEALTFAANLDLGIRQNATKLIRALQERFSINDPAETQRANLNHVRKGSRENLQEYASRVRAMMSKAYPDIGNTATYEQLLLQHFMNGLPDQNLAYEVMVRQPKTINEAVNYVRWHECCKETTRKRSNLRHLSSDPDIEYENFDETLDEDEPDVRRLNNRKFVTEERLQQFARDLKRNISTKKFDRDEKDQPNQQANRHHKIVCYGCGMAGHIVPNCPLKKGQSDKNLSENFRGLDLMAERQPKA